MNSHRKAVAAAREGKFRSELAPVPIPQKKGEPVLVAMDESPRDDASLEQLSRLKPVFKKDGTVTAGNAPGTNDGAAAVIVASPAKAKELGLEPMAAIAGQAVSGVEPRDVMMAPVSAVEKLLKKTGWEREAVDLYEINEAFSVQAIAVIEQLRLDPRKVNVNGGSVALGHPIGCSGARILVTLLHEMVRRDARGGLPPFAWVAATPWQWRLNDKPECNLECNSIDRRVESVKRDWCRRRWSIIRTTVSSREPTLRDV